MIEYFSMRWSVKGGLIAIPIPIDIMINEDTLPETLHTYASVHGITFGMTTTIESPEKGTKIQINAGNLNSAHTKAHRNKTIRKKYAAKVILTSPSCRTINTPINPPR